MSSGIIYNVSSIIRFFVALDNVTAASATDSGLGVPVEAATYGNFDIWSSLEEWASILLHREIEELVPEADPDIIVSGDNEPLVLLVPSALTAALAHADGETLGRTAERWIALRAEDGEVIDEELAHELVTDVAALAAKAERTKGSLYCQIS